MVTQVTSEGSWERSRRLPAAERRVVLLDVAERLFVERGFSGVTMEDIAREAGVTRPIVYRHFQALGGVYVACVSRVRDAYAEELVDLIAQAEADEVPPRERLRRGADVFFQILERDQGRWKLVFGGQTPLSGEFALQLEELRLGTIEAIGSALLASADEGVSSDRLDAAAHAISGVGERLGLWWLRHPDTARARVVQHFVDFIWEGVAPYAR